MGDVTGFKKYNRRDVVKEPVVKRKNHWKEFIKLPDDESLKQQGARCMDCGVPFCQYGCPVSNIIPDWNDLVYRDDWETAFNRLMKTNNFPEFTGRVCPAPCENSCVLAINKPAVTIKNIELAIIERAYKEGWMKPEPPETRFNKKVAIVGSGPAGLACADQLNHVGYNVTVFEKNEYIGGLLTLGIPSFKMEKTVVERRVKLMQQEGVEFKTGINIGVDGNAKDLLKSFDAVVLAGGAEQPRDLLVEGSELNGIYFAMEYLTQQNRENLGKSFNGNKITAKDKNVIVLGGGDTGSDCIGTAIRQGAKSVKNFELLPQPPRERDSDNPWPQWAFIERTSTSHEEGCERDYGIMTKKFSGSNGKVSKLHATRLEFGEKDPETGRKPMKEIPGSEFTVDADLILLALGFVGPRKNELLEQLNVELDESGNVKTNDSRMTCVEGVFAAGDMRRGQSLVVWAINEGRDAAKYVHNYLKRKS
ncbi:MAG: glutamate synthase subunit beta [Melioribacteraceae bacterium]|nr:glutamate synthase subunit beta [Melioribacteraceae bacterium]